MSSFKDPFYHLIFSVQQFLSIKSQWFICSHSRPIINQKLNYFYFELLNLIVFLFFLTILIIAIIYPFDFIYLYLPYFYPTIPSFNFQISFSIFHFHSTFSLNHFIILKFSFLILFLFSIINHFSSCPL